MTVRTVKRHNSCEEIQAHEKEAKRRNETDKDTTKLNQRQGRQQFARFFWLEPMPLTQDL